MKALLREAMQAGAAGLSTGLIYVPGYYADTNEVVELAKVVYHDLKFTGEYPGKFVPHTGGVK